jgi:uncharacterized surface protein with fasciclin (FAS1) repeats
MNKKFGLMITLIALLLVTVMGSASAEFEPNIVDIAASDGRFDTLHTAIVAAGLADTLASADNEFTVFAPTDAAFAALEAASPGTIASLLADPQGALQQVLLYHTVSGALDSSAVLSESSLPSLQGESLAVSKSGDAAFVNNSQIIITDVKAKNGIIHVIDAVLVPKAISNPTAATVAQAEMNVEKAVQENEADVAAAEPTQTIAEIAVANGSFNTLVAALSAAGLVDTFAQPGDYTVFAPTDDAFAKIPESTLQALLADPSGDLTDILTYHVVGDSLTRNQLATDDNVPTLNGKTLSINKDGVNIVDINGAKVLIYNILASNGIIHVIDTVLIP